ncbi:MAG: 23S rRNA (uracil(1939)-C(5))-methyltransferase RlmD [Candidatus Abyssobacteria bacterium SURF_17]|uniref:23S rRNA (Uracil(1939)-C(5))-methyltransferase RlmD n=1 Tax=Candidatus Abyssobacteria bacterium SURF_17 TaxID=2093361 RepID=A0A419ENI5_9BACT|nr:MAG: 23S rRNA (uracil(1939)-C(5))-methyltransferase RlmD [Candidatus Abyssubacteria bacterium SURF_17]
MASRRHNLQFATQRDASDIWRSMEVRPVRIEKLVAGGYGLGYVDGRVIFVPYSAPEDEILVEVAPPRRGVSWGSIQQILSPAPSRISPFCAHYTRCGGCQLQHMSYADQLESKRLVVDEALRRLAGLRDAEIVSCIGSPMVMGYRSRARLHCEGGKVGFQGSRSNRVIPLEFCPLLMDNMNTCLKHFSSYMSAHPIRGLSALQMTEDTDSRVVVTLEMDSLPGSRLIGELRDTVRVAGASVRVGHHRHVLWGEDYSTVSVAGRTFRVSPGSFFQLNRSLLPVLIEEVLKTVSGNDIAVGIELYAGVGVFAIMLSERARKLMAVEWNRDAAEDALANLKSNRISNVEVIPLSAENALDLMFSRNIKPELVLIDPPRDGLSSAVRSKLMKLLPRQLIYISCNPATLARDIKSILSSGSYRLEKVKPLDMFPHTAHIECIASFMRNQD